MSRHARYPCPGGITRTTAVDVVFELRQHVRTDKQGRFCSNNVAVAVGGVGTVVEEMPLAEACSMRPLACDVALSKTTTFFNEETNPHIGPLPLAAAANRDVVASVQQPRCSRAHGLVRKACAFRVTPSLIAELSPSTVSQESDVFHTFS